MLHGFVLFLLTIGLLLLSRYAAKTVRIELIVLALVLIIIAAGASEMKKQVYVPEPLAIIMERAKMVLALPPHRVPVLDKAKVHIAASHYARCNESDPFAYGRIALYMQQGLEAVDTIQQEASQCLRIKEMRRHDREVKNNGVQ